MNFEEEVKEILGDMANFPESEGKELFIIGCYKKINALAKKTALSALPKKMEHFIDCQCDEGEKSARCTCDEAPMICIHNEVISQAETKLKEVFHG